MDKYEFLDYTSILSGAIDIETELGRLQTRARINKTILSTWIGEQIARKFYPGIQPGSRTNCGVMENITFVRGMAHDIEQNDLERGIREGYYFCVVLMIRPYTQKGEPNKVQLDRYIMRVNGEMESGVHLELLRE